ncbi:PEGA domain-containing protein [Patescibacteria group bacterium]|nr:PEGA domain-containing protein [Patescibacteria group bacterium]
MTFKIRRIILIGTILFFVIVAPTALLYSYGYSFDWQKKKVVLTGGFYFESLPKKADVYLNDKLKEKTPVFIKRLLPKEYQIKITKDGYHSWQKNLRIESKLVTEAKNILLIPLNPKIKIINEALPIDFSLEEFIQTEESNNVFYIQEPSYILYKTDKENSFQKQISLTPLPINHQYQIFVSTNEQIAVLDENKQLYLLNQEIKTFRLINQNVQGLQFSNDNKLLYFTPSEIWVYYLNRKNNQQELITRLSQKIKQAIWHNKTNEHIIFSVDQNIKITELDGRNGRNTNDLIELNFNQMAYSEKNKLLYLVKDKQLLSISLE